ncbi:uncharacterized protein C05D11.13-like isoform X2 [Periplaneta americana]
MNVTKVEPESDEESHESQSEIHPYAGTDQAIMTSSHSYIELKSENIDNEVESNMDSSSTHQLCSEPVFINLKQEPLQEPDFFSAYKCEVEVKEMQEREKQLMIQTYYHESMNENYTPLLDKKSKLNELMRIRRQNETPEQRQRRLMQMNNYAKLRRASENADQREKRLTQMNNHAKQRRANESLEERQRRLTQMNFYAKQRRATETPEQHEERKKRQRERQRLRRINETAEERQKRLTQMNNYVKLRRSNGNLGTKELSFSQSDDCALQEGNKVIREQQEQQVRQLPSTPKPHKQQLQKTPESLEQNRLSDTQQTVSDMSGHRVEWNRRPQEIGTMQEHHADWYRRQQEHSTTTEQYKFWHKHQPMIDTHRQLSEIPGHCQQCITHRQEIQDLQRTNEVLERKQEWFRQQQEVLCKLREEWCRQQKEWCRRQQEEKNELQEAKKSHEQFEEKCR